MLITLLILVPVTWFLYNILCLFANYRRASQLRVPRVCTLISPDNPLWIALQTSFPSIVDAFRLESISFLRRSRFGWEFRDRYKTHQRLGDAWVLVTPNRNWLHVVDAHAISDVFGRYRDFGRCVWMLEILNVFGPSVSTAQGADWQRQRRLTAPAFNEQKSSLVWSEAIRQADDMRQCWSLQTETGLSSTATDVRTLALHVLAYVGFQKSYPFGSISKDPEGSGTSTYRDSLAIILHHVLIAVVLPARIFDLPFLPANWKRVGLAKRNFRKYMLDQLGKEKELQLQGKPGSGSLMSNLVRASEEVSNVKAPLKAPGGEPQEVKTLTIDEILGNVFVFNFAGHDTTAIVLATSLYSLVAHPEVQDWISEELNCYLPSENPESWVYDIHFPKLKRTLAVLLETVRLYNPLLSIPKYTGSNHCTLKVGDETKTIPPNTLVIPTMMALHTHPRYWGSDSLSWRPSRWIEPEPKGPEEARTYATTLPEEQLLVPEKGTFIAWSEGVQNCPGKKFAQVEFVATMATLFRNYKVQPVTVGTETMKQARRRVLDVVENSQMELLLQMQNPERVKVRWSRR